MVVVLRKDVEFKKLPLIKVILDFVIGLYFFSAIAAATN
ncbi:hypothetical protein Bache_1082 [Bacteroides helcogenes P 36-108]|uniref:Uncharacterized protein n=1 Tax=Bacteroides helcogenes (strain ATCC 35417 / DSM 20613 / JCM 6297 / CCUG 15421 / P 36-108) TaxID=693979 RepID=E6SRZ0_BACT6|nr:hypothetical protein Bache_1082 [Bacteroides helcogenes P 36-108]